MIWIYIFLSCKNIHVIVFKILLYKPIIKQTVSVISFLLKTQYSIIYVRKTYVNLDTNLLIIVTVVHRLEHDPQEPCLLISMALYDPLPSSTGRPVTCF